MKILLVYISGMPDRRDPYISLLPTGVCSLHAVLREAGYDAVLANLSGWSKGDIKKYLSDQKPDIVGISQWTHNRHVSMDLARIARNVVPSCTIISGGAHATFSFTDLLAGDSPIDCVVI